VTEKKYCFRLDNNDQSFFILRDDSDDVSFPFHCCCCCTLDASLVCFRRDSLGRLDADARESCEPVGELSLSPTLARGEPTDGLGCCWIEPCFSNDLIQIIFNSLINDHKLNQIKKLNKTYTWLRLAASFSSSRCLVITHPSTPGSLGTSLDKF
jgi:hypothetical protein